MGDYNTYLIKIYLFGGPILIIAKEFAQVLEYNIFLDDGDDWTMVL